MANNLQNFKLILFGGKGGVGKSTCACTAAVQLADEGKKVLLWSTDPAHSLSDSLEQEIGPDIKPVNGEENLFAIEVDAEKLFIQFKEKYDDDIKKILATGTYLDEEDISELLSLSIPGIDEVMGFNVLVDLIEKGGYDIYIMDTAPTGHALRLLLLPELVDQWIKMLARMRYKYRYVVSRLSKRDIYDTADDFLVKLKKTVKKIQSLLRDDKICEFVVVVNPQKMVISETKRLINDLKNFQIPLMHLVVNRVISGENQTCTFCSKKWNGEKQNLKDIEKSFSSSFNTFKILEYPYEVKGIKILKELPFPIEWFF